MKYLLLAVGFSVMGSLTLPATAVYERDNVRVDSEGITCQQAGQVVFEDSFKQASVWPEVVNYEKRLTLAFNDASKQEAGFLVSGEKTPNCDTAWNLRTAKIPFTVQGEEYRFRLRLSTDLAINVGTGDGSPWWTAIHWYGAGWTNVNRLVWSMEPCSWGEVESIGAIPKGAQAFKIQLGFDVPNINEGTKLLLRDVKLEVLPKQTKYAAEGWFASEVHQGSGEVSWLANVPTGCAVKMQVATASNLDDLLKATFKGPDGTDKTFWDKPFMVKEPWMRYKVVLCGSGENTPCLKSVTVGKVCDDNWENRGDGRPPSVKVLSNSPTLNQFEELRLRIVDESLVDWNKLVIKVDGVDMTRDFKRDGEILTLPKRAQAWKDGLHTVDVNVCDFHRNANVAHKVFFIGEAPKTEKITLRDDGLTLIDGKPFFPIGIYGVMRREFNAYNFERAFDDLEKGGFNMAHSYSSPHEDEFLDAAWHHKFRIWNVARIPDARFINVERHHPAIIAWYLGDDTSANTTPARLEDLQDAVRAVDPTRITTQADGVGAGQGTEMTQYTPYVRYTDNFLAEIYPVHYNNQETHETCVAKVIRDMKAFARDVKNSGVKEPRSCWPIIQYFKGWGWQRFPTHDELFAMSFASLVYGAQGITWYTYGGTVEPEIKKFNYGITTSAERWQNMTNLATRIKFLIPALVERKGVQPPKPVILEGPKQDVLSNDSISVLVKRQGGYAWVIAVNSTTKPIKAKLFLDNVAATGEVLWENRKVTLKDGAWVETFKPYGVAVYRFALNNK